jgi:hypothetical protein
MSSRKVLLLVIGLVTLSFLVSCSGGREFAPKAFPEGLYLGAGMIGQSNVIFGPAIGALPNGRANPTRLAECNSPFPGADRNGPSAVIRSMSKLPTQRFALGGL